jgi:hypothetical protein
MGSSTVLIGGSMSDASANAAPFDVRYVYVHSQPAPSSDYYSAALCQAGWSSWWGCWSGTTTAPGYYVSWWDTHVAQATYQGRPRPQKMFFTWYSLRDLGDLAGSGDGPGEVKAIDRVDLLTRYMNDYRFFLQTIGSAHDMIDIEPDFWGYVRSLGDPHQVAAQVSAANPTCRSFAGSSVRRNTPDHDGCVDGDTWTQAQARPRIRVLAADLVRGGHGRGVQAVGHRSQDRLSVADGERRAAAGASGGGRPLQPLPLIARAAAHRHPAGCRYGCR